MREHLMEPALFEEFCEAYTRAVNEWRIAQRAGIAGKGAELKRIERELEKLVRAIMDGVAALSIKDKMLALEERMSAKD
jgi:site-specific DNA recombinase